MGSFSFLFVLLIYIVFVAWPLWRIVGKTGLPAALSLLFLVPIVNVLFFYYLAFARWPVEQD
jgi:hypothetical protein